MENLIKATKFDIDAIMNIEKEAFAEEIQESKDVFLERIEIFPDGFFILEENNKNSPLKKRIWVRNSIKNHQH